MAKARTTGFIFEGPTPKDVLAQIWDSVHENGIEIKTQRGLAKSIRGATLIINNPADEKNCFPYWSRDEDNWYQDNFVRKETNLPPELNNKKQDVYTYKYAWRSRYYDGGYGHITSIVNLLKKFHINRLKIRSGEELAELLKHSYRFIHPETMLAVLSWKGLKLINFYLENPQLIKLELATQRRDTLESVITELKHSPNSRRAIIPSFTYEHIDHSGAAGGVPVYQNYQLYVNFDKKGEPVGLTSLHLHRAIDAFGGAQLDINHDREWGQLASRKLGLPLQKIVIYVNDVWASFDKNHQNLSQKTDIRSWLFTVTDSYDSKTEDIQTRLSTPAYKKKIEYTLKTLNT